jgi:TonB family protein
MRRMILSSLVLLPVLTLSHAAFAAGGAAKPAESYSSAVRESVKTQVSGNFVEAALRMGGTLEYSFRATVPAPTAPKVTRTVEVQLSEQELAAQPNVTSVVVHAMVDEQGVPHNVGITHSAGAIVDEKAIAAVSQYRFIPATLDNQPTWAEVSVAIKIEKK